MMEMEDFIGDMAAEWQLDQPLGLTLFDDPLESLGRSEPVKHCSTAPDVVEHVSHDDRWEDPFSEQWMEDTGLAELFDVIPTELATVKQVHPSSDDYSAYAINLLAEILETSETSSKQEPVCKPEPSTPPLADVGIAPVISFDTSQDSEICEIFLRDNCGVLGSPLSVEDVESLLSGSEPSSPGTSVPPSPSPGTSVPPSLSPGTSVPPSSVTRPISDLEKLLTSDMPISVHRVKNSTSRNIRPKIKTVSDTCDINMEFLSKKEKKKIQNKNAAIRYRMKKKVESETIKSEEKQLEDKNTGLRDKVDQLQREIQYMKNLMDEVRNAKQLKSGF
ncbi:cyclic AMP-dependent transcription factor ATF-5-like [Gigantopelta aegis]|uniref:cyclic AMP-dependent transcription factor ATF-5-like n=1 Tax=Gigantopelta aegis TaxID=1735272 RepID=UPI001B888552|nr:cyclic AMP-dependent transcription factor ATF-5-like [Gigantopelta aegis]